MGATLRADHAPPRDGRPGSWSNWLCDAGLDSDNFTSLEIQVEVGVHVHRRTVVPPDPALTSGIRRSLMRGLAQNGQRVLKTNPRSKYTCGLQDLPGDVQSLVVATEVTMILPPNNEVCWTSVLTGQVHRVNSQ